MARFQLRHRHRRHQSGATTSFRGRSDQRKNFDFLRHGKSMPDSLRCPKRKPGGDESGLERRGGSECPDRSRQVASASRDGKYSSQQRAAPKSRLAFARTWRRIYASALDLEGATCSSVGVAYCFNVGRPGPETAEWARMQETSSFRWSPRNQC